jgi:hypothetical protein
MPALQEQRGKNNSAPELPGRTHMVLDDEHVAEKDQRQQVDGIEPGETGEPEIALAQVRPVGIVVGQHEAREQDEEPYKDVGVIDHRVQQLHVRRREVEQHDVHGQQRADASQSRQLRLANRSGGPGLIDECGGSVQKLQPSADLVSKDAKIAGLSQAFEVLKQRFLPE